MENVSLVGAFVAGVLSFISPCVLPLVPGYLSFISGVSLEEMRGMTPVAAKHQVIITSLLFILGFSLVFVSLGASATYLGQFLLERLTFFGKIAGVLLIIFGLHTIGVFRIPFLLNEARVQANTRSANMPANRSLGEDWPASRSLGEGWIGAVIVGISFAFGWTPCIGPILSAILLVAAQQESANQGILLLTVYSLGLAIPFLLTALAINQFFVVFSRIRRHYHAIEIVSGALMIVVGVLIFTNRFTIIAQWLTPYLPTF